MNNKIKIALLGIVIVIVSGCQEPALGGSPFTANPLIPQKKLMTSDGPVEAICYIDLEKGENPLNVKDYIFEGNSRVPDTQFFNYVVLSYAYLTKDSRGYVAVEMRPALKHILDNSITYIKPLHQKGIKVAIEVRSGDYDDSTEDGIGVGFGTMDMATINEFTKVLKLIIERYGIDGFEFNDVGGGKNSYPPNSRNLKKFQSNDPLYPDDLFMRDNEPITDPDEINAILWREGGSNFGNLMQRTNEALKKSWTVTIPNGNGDSADIKQELRRIIMVRGRKNHGSHLLANIRNAYMPDAYSGANRTVMGNLNFIINDTPYDDEHWHATLINEEQNLADIGSTADGKYAPFAINLRDQKDTSTARAWAKKFVLINPVGADNDSNWNKYGAIYVTGLRAISEDPTATEYLTNFSYILFGDFVLLTKIPGAGDYKKTW